ncbi:VCBS repeat-containing protein [Candidatus Poribacteria bacterium]|nr:VCBS repeat-containing protein [Candidatus Poribacteria bacterium]
MPEKIVIRKRETRKKVVIRVIILLIILTPFLFYWNKPVYFKLPWRIYRASSFTAIVQISKFLVYMTTYGSKYQFDAEKGFKDLDIATQEYASQKNPNLFELAKLEWHRGNFAAAVSDLEEYHRRHKESESSLFWLAMSYMRLAEAENCLAHLVADAPSHDHLEESQMCVLPLTVYHQKGADSRKAAKLFEKLLDQYDKNNRRYQWLLNFCYMTVGGFPDEVPPSYRVTGNFIDYFYGDKKQEMEKKYADLSFHDRAKELGVNSLDAGKGVAVEDFDRDGYLDIITGGSYSPIRYYWNNKGEGFIDKSEESGVSTLKGTHVITAADYDNDGWMDLFVSRPMGPPSGDFVLLRNNEGGSFSDVTVSTGLLPEASRRKGFICSWASAWGDVDNDGDLDLFLANWGFYNNLGKKNPMSSNVSSKLYKNEGGRFVDATEEFGLKPVVKGENVFGAAFGDYDNDGFIDLFLTCWTPGGVLLKNVGGKTFKPVDSIPSGEMGFMTAFVDINHDGLLDIYMGGTGLADSIIAQAIFSEGFKKYNSGNNTIGLQTREGKFEDRKDFFTGKMPVNTMGSNFGDLNNDGAYDFYLGTGGPEGWAVIPNLMYVGIVDENGVPTGYMDNISMLHGFGTIQKGHGIVFFDYDNDGDQDIYSSLGGMWPGDRWPNQFFVNESHLTNTWTKIRLRGRKSNYYGLGARIKVMAENGKGRPMNRYYDMNNHTGFGSSPYLAHIGLLDAVQIKQVEVTWPGDTKPKIYNANLNTMNILDENEGIVQKVEKVLNIATHNTKTRR